MNRSGLIWLMLTIAACGVPKPTVTEKNNLKVTGTSADSTWFNWLTPYRDSLHKTLDRVIAKSDTAWNMGRPCSNLGNLITDCLIDYCNHYLHDSLRYAHPEIALMNNGGVRNSLPKGNITLTHLFEILPFENEIVLVKCKGAVLEKIIQHTAERGGDAFAGITYTLSNYYATDIRIRNNFINPDQDYWLATNDYLAEGGDGFVQFREASQKITTQIKIRDAVKKVLETETHFAGKIQPRTERRINLVR